MTRRDRAERRDERDAGEVERARDERGRGDREVRIRGLREQREDPAEAPADELHRPPAGVVGDGPHRAREHVLDPVLQPERAVAEADGAVVDEVGLVPALQQVLGERAAAPQVEAERGRRERRDEQHRQRGRAAAAAAERVVAVHAPLRALVDQRRRHPPRVGEPAAHGGVVEVDGGGDRVGGGRDQAHRCGPIDGGRRSRTAAPRIAGVANVCRCAARPGGARSGRHPGRMRTAAGFPLASLTGKRDGKRREA